MLATVLLLPGCAPEAGSPHPPDPASQAMNRGVALMGQYDYPGAVTAFEETLQLQPELPGAKVNLAIALFNRAQKEDGDLDRAAQLLDEVLAKDPGHLRALYFRGITLQHLGETEASLPYFEKVVQQRPDDGAVWYLIGLSRQRLGQPAEAELLKAIELKPYLSSAYYRLSQIAMLEGDTNKAGPYLDAFKRLRESPLNQLIEVPQYGAMGELALAEPLPVSPGQSAPSARYQLGEARVLYTSEETLFRSPDTAGGLGGAALGDLNHDGRGDLVFATTSEAAGGKLIALLSTAAGEWREATTAPGLGAVRNARSCAMGDFDNDEINDLVVACTESNHLFRGVSNAVFLDVSAAITAIGKPADCAAVLLLDADHDGDLDLFICSSSVAGARNQLLNNDADGTFTDLAATNGLACVGTATVMALPGDLDGDRDMDLVLLQQGSPARVFMNNLLGAFTESKLEGAAANIRGDLGGVLQDLDGNETLDLLVLGGEPAAVQIFLGDGHGGFTAGTGLAAAQVAASAWGPLTGFRAADLDLDGDLDLVVFGREGHLLLNDATGNFTISPEGWRPSAGWALAGAELGDVNGDLVPDLLCLEHGAPSRVTLYPGQLSPPGTALALSPTGVRGRDKRTRSPASGFGVEVTVRAGQREQSLFYTGLSGGANQSVVPLVMGLSGQREADYVRLVWPDGVAQVESGLAAGRLHRVSEIQRKISSCPVLFAWNGDRFEFITDFAGVGGLGYFVAPGVSAPPQVLEHVKIEPEQLRPRNGGYELRVTEPMEEAAYVDQLELWAVDHAAQAMVYPDERLAISGPAPTHEWLVIEEPVFPRKAISTTGEDCLEQVLKVDRRYAYDPPLDRRFIGFCTPHTLELHFGDELAGFGAGDRVFLFIHGFIEYPYSQTVYAAGQATVAWEPIRVDVSEPGGEWRTIVPDAGAPGGMGRMMTIELTGRLAPSVSRLRLTTNLEIGYDQVFVGRHNPTATVRRHRLALTHAALRRIGFPRESSPDGAWPLVYDYQRMDPTAPFHVLGGAYTRYGEVGSLLGAFDDRYVIMGPGDEIALRFAAEVLPSLGDGLTRSFILVSQSYCKDMDLYTQEPETLAPLPFQGMSRYPYPPSERYPDDASHREYHARYNTRWQ